MRPLRHGKGLLKSFMPWVLHNWVSCNNDAAAAIVSWEFEIAVRYSLRSLLKKKPCSSLILSSCHFKKIDTSWTPRYHWKDFCDMFFFPCQYRYVIMFYAFFTLNICKIIASWNVWKINIITENYVCIPLVFFRNDLLQVVKSGIFRELFYIQVFRLCFWILVRCFTLNIVLDYLWIHAKCIINLLQIIFHSLFSFFNFFF